MDIFQKLSTTKSNLSKNSHLGYMVYLLKKVHKPEIPLRPIVSRVNTAYDLSVHLADILSPLTGKSDYTVTNSTYFVSTISHERIQENEVMVSFDVESLFTNVPIEGAVKATLCKLENDPGLAERTTLHLHKLPTF